jgi:hypothetical protein
MDSEKTNNPQTKYTTLREKITWANYLDSRGIIGLVIACKVYKNEAGEDREVLISNTSKQPNNEIEGASILGIVSMDRSAEDILEIRVEGTDNSAINFCEELRMGLREENYLLDKFRERYRELIQQERRR